MTDFDVVVVGAGLAGGLTAAAYLQAAGARTCLVEAGAACGPFYTSYELDGVRFDHSPVNFSGMSPALHELRLEELGYRVERPTVLYGVLDGAGRKTTFYPSPDETARELAVWSTHDAETWRSVVSALPAELTDELFFKPEPDIAYAVARTEEALELDLSNLTAPQLVETLFESEPVRLAAMALPALNLFGDLLEPGQGALTWLWSLLLRSSVAPSGNGTLVAALERRFLNDGGTLLTAEPVTRIYSGGVDTIRRRLRARAVVSNLGARLTSELTQTELRPNWSSARRTIATADVVFDRAPRLPLPVPRLYLLWRTWDECLAWLHCEDERAFFGHLELTAFGRGLRIRFGTGPWLDDDWDSRRDRFEAYVDDLLGRLELGARVQRVVVKTPADHWRENAAATHGNPVGGDVVAGQWLGERLPYRSGIEGVYVSNSVWPPALSHLGPGRNAAAVVAADLGLPFPPGAGRASVAVGPG